MRMDKFCLADILGLDMLGLDEGTEVWSSILQSYIYSDPTILCEQELSNQLLGSIQASSLMQYGRAPRDDQAQCM